MFVLLSGCKEQKRAGTAIDDKAQQIIDLAIAAKGGKVIENAEISFDFRQRHYIANRKAGHYEYHRVFEDSLGNTVNDILSNNGFQRLVNGEKVSLDQEKADAYANSTNSVIYFTLLPYLLNDEAVVKKYLGEATILGLPYHKIKVTFTEEGGGKDFEDEYIYWFNKETFTLDFLAYNFVVDGGGARFRKAVNQREVSGVLFADYINFKPKEDTREVEKFDELFVNGGMEELSIILNENIEVKPLGQKVL